MIFMKEKEQPQEFKVQVNVTSTQIKIRVPKSLQGERFEMVHQDGKILLYKSDEGCVVSVPSAYNTYAYLQFGRKKWGKDVPFGQYEQDVVMQDGSFEISIKNERSPSEVRNIKPAAKFFDINNSSAAKAVEYLNEFAKKTGFAFEVSDNRLALTKVERIG